MSCSKGQPPTFVGSSLPSSSCLPLLGSSGGFLPASAPVSFFSVPDLHSCSLLSDLWEALREPNPGNLLGTSGWWSWWLDFLQSPQPSLLEEGVFYVCEDSGWVVGSAGRSSEVSRVSSQCTQDQKWKWTPWIQAENSWIQGKSAEAGRWRF